MQIEKSDIKLEENATLYLLQFQYVETCVEPWILTETPEKRRQRLNIKYCIQMIELRQIRGKNVKINM